MKKIYCSIGISLFIMSSLFSQICLAENFYSENQKVKFHKILSVQTNHKTGAQFIEVKDTIYPVLPNALIICSNDRKCRITSLELPLDARIVLIEDENEILSVVEIKPHEE